MIKYAKSHEWFNTENGEVGITSNAIELLGDIVFLELPQVGQSVEKDGSIAVVESVKAASDIYSPVSGKILDTNSDLENSPEKLNENHDTWLFKIEITDDNEVDKLLDEISYKAGLDS